ncbi:Ger(x)C family spore germination protein [Paenibacillus sp. FSL W8-0426]|uniref:Ger(x)C family spore germination protein n=1 Tax=Paenibacillus sp. FSL W8-0426 TaxID=2921714 RepID=UPI0030DA5C86
MIKRWFSVLMLALSMVVAGCGNLTEMNDLGITTATGIDRQNGKWLVTYQTIVPPASAGKSSSGGSQTSVNTFTSEGKTINEAVSKSSLENSKKLYFAHTHVLLIGEEAARHGIAEVMDEYYRSIDARESVKVLVADGQAKEYLKFQVPPEKQPGRALSGILNRNTEMGSFYPVMTLHEIALKMTSDSRAVGIPTITVKGKERSELESTDIFKQTSPPVKLRLAGLSVFSKDKKIGELSESESLGISWLTNRIKIANLTFSGDNGEINSFLVRKAVVNVKPLKSGLHYIVHVDVKVNAELSESTSQKEITSASDIRILQRQAEQVIKAQVVQGWTANQRLRVDLLGLANKIHQRHPKDWKAIQENWPQELAQMDVEVDVGVSLKRVGLLQDSFSKLLKSKEQEEH